MDHDEYVSYQYVAPILALLLMISATSCKAESHTSPLWDDALAWYMSWMTESKVNRLQCNGFVRSDAAVQFSCGEFSVVINVDIETPEGCAIR